MQLMYLLDQLEEIIENGTTLPFSNKTLVNVEEVLAIIQDVRMNLPDEIKQSQWIKEERKKILVEAQKEAETMVQETESYIKKLVDENEITKNAYELAEEIIQKAQQNAREIRLGTKEYADSILEKLQSQLQDTLLIIEENRTELRK